jgi:hypothetical protein
MPKLIVKLVFLGTVAYYFDSEEGSYGYIEGESSSYFVDEKPEKYDQRILYAYIISKLG